MKNKKLTQVRFHIGVNIAGQVLTSADTKTPATELELLPVGVHVKIRGHERIVPFANCLQISVEDEKK